MQLLQLTTFLVDKMGLKASGGQESTSFLSAVGVDPVTLAVKVTRGAQFEVIRLESECPADEIVGHLERAKSQVKQKVFQDLL